MIRRVVPAYDQIVSPRGIFVMRAYRRGVLIDQLIDRNLVVDGIKEVLAQLLGEGVAGKVVTRIGFGSNGTPPVVGDNALTTQYVRDISAVSYPVAGQVQFDWQLDSGEANGLAIREWGLITDDGALLVARKARASAILKEADVTLEGSWIIVFNN
jgi:hypothetical protein